MMCRSFLAVPTMTDHSFPSSPLVPSRAAAADTVPAAAASPHPASRKGRKVRSAWIGFAGRVTAQLIGAIATVGLGYALVTNHAGRKAEMAAAAAAAAVPTAAVVPVAPPAATLVRGRRAAGPALAVLPFEDFSPTAKGTALADGITEALTAAIAQDGRVHVTSRTSAMHVRRSPAPLRDIAAALGVDVVVEGSIVRQGDRARVTVQLIDAATDAHLWAQTYDRQVRDVLAFEGEIGAAITRDLASVLPRDLQTPLPADAATNADARTPQGAARVAF
jgi:TolB-like protein